MQNDLAGVWPSQGQVRTEGQRGTGCCGVSRPRLSGVRPLSTSPPPRWGVRAGPPAQTPPSLTSPCTWARLCLRPRARAHGLRPPSALPRVYFRGFSESRCLGTCETEQGARPCSRATSGQPLSLWVP